MGHTEFKSQPQSTPAQLARQLHTPPRPHLFIGWSAWAPYFRYKVQKARLWHAVASNSIFGLKRACIVGSG